MPVRSRLLVHQRTIAQGTTNVLWTTPTGRVAIFRQLVVTNASAAAQQVILSVRRNNVSVNVLRRTGLPVDSSVEWLDCNLVLEGGDALLLNSAGSDAAALVSVYAGGSLLLGAAT
jgi:hypothetical protein